MANDLSARHERPADVLNDRYDRPQLIALTENQKHFPIPELQSPPVARTPKLTDPQAGLARNEIILTSFLFHIMMYS